MRIINLLQQQKQQQQFIDNGKYLQKESVRK